MNSTNQTSLLNQTVNLLTEESFITDLKTFFVSSWHIIQVLSSVLYLLISQVYVWGQSANSWLSTKLQPLKVKVYNTLSCIDHPLAQFISNLLEDSKLESSYQKWKKMDEERLNQQTTTTALTDCNGNPITIRLHPDSVFPNQTPLTMESQEQPLTHVNS